MRYVCIHGHFYQPPRESPWSGRVEKQPSAAPFHDWNERIAAECYRPNGRAPVLGPDGEPRRFVDNYRHISFDFGPTLLAWFERAAPDLLEHVVRADRAARARFSGHGPATAQAWGHPILPLCNDADRRTQIVWGLAEFAFRFGRRAEGLWLPETAADTATLEALSLHGVRFTVLAPHQAGELRLAGSDVWVPVENGALDTRRAYRAPLPSGRSIDLFFYDGPLAAAIAFEGLLKSGADLTRRLLAGFDEGEGDDGRLVHVATDGETFGHHHRHGEMALAHAIELLERTQGVALTCYGEFLERHPPRDEVRIVENGSWSCPHELARWSRACDCAAETGTAWRAPLREAVRALRDAISPAWERAAARFLADPWAARDDWIDVLVRPDDERLRRFVDAHGRPDVRAVDRRYVMRLFELQQRVLQTETSCAWFFEDLARIETIQVLRYAARAIELARELLDVELEEPFVRTLAHARSADPKIGDGRRLWETRVRGSGRSPRRTPST